MIGTPTAATRRLLPGWVRGYQRGWVRDDLVAGLTLTVILVPQGMAYASLAGTPPITGLYAAAVALVAYAWLGSSAHVSFGPFALIALLSATAVEPLAEGDPARFLALSGALAMMVGAIHLLLGVARAGAIAALISRPVVVGFTSAVGLLIAASQVRDLTGVEVARSERFVDAVIAAAEAVPRTHLPTLAVGVLALAILLFGQRRSPKVPSALLVVAAGIGAALLLDLDRAGVALVGPIPSGLPFPVLPQVTLQDLRALLPSAAVLAVIAIASNLSMAMAIAVRSRERIEPRQELVASGAANLAAGVVSGFPVAASFTRTMVVHTAGARTQLAGVVAAVALAVTLLVLTPVLEPLPRAVLAAIVIVAVLGLIDVRSARAIVELDRAEGGVLLLTFLATLGLGAELGLAAGVAAHVAVHLARRMRPELVELGRVHGTRVYRNVDRYPTITDPRGVLLRLDGTLDFLSAQAVTGELRTLAAERPELSWLVLDAGGITGMDPSGVHALHEVQRHLAAAGVALHLCSLRGPQRDLIERAGLWEALIEGTCHPTIEAALAAAGVPPDVRLRRPDPAEDPPDGVW
jgi:sulfate permease, SulP family